jgi:hypothetical protein
MTAAASPSLMLIKNASVGWMTSCCQGFKILLGDLIKMSDNETTRTRFRALSNTTMHEDFSALGVVLDNLAHLEEREVITIKTLIGGRIEIVNDSLNPTIFSKAYLSNRDNLGSVFLRDLQMLGFTKLALVAARQKFTIDSIERLEHEHDLIYETVRTTIDFSQRTLAETLTLNDSKSPCIVHNRRAIIIMNT